MSFPLRPVPSGSDDTFDHNNARPIVPATPKANSQTETTPAILEPRSATPGHTCLEDRESRETTSMDNTSIASGPTTSRESGTSPRIATVQDTRAKRRKDRAPTGPYSRHTSSTPSVQDFSPSISNPGTSIVDAEHGLYRPFFGVTTIQTLRHYTVERTFSSEQCARLADFRREKQITRTHRRDAKLPCPLCDETSTSTTNLLAHLYSGKHLRIRVKCDFCGVLRAISSLPNHVLMHHPERDNEYVQMMRMRERPVFEELDE
ncbi:hypothetical protein PENSPDRAFT_694521 [Peniophora sp. CONT]|nr:hypothetical protein PENSPDRAFT_694521 [Peniophora sp. CONT]